MLGLLSSLLLSGCGLEPDTLSVTSTTADAVLGENSIVTWNRTAQRLILDTSLKGSQAASQYLAYVNVAIYEAVNAVVGTFEPYALDLVAPPETSLDAAVASAAAHVLRAKLPGLAGEIDAAYAAALDAIPDSQAKTDGVALGDAAGAGVLALRTDDNVEASDPVTLPAAGPGVWQPLPGQTPLAPWARHARPWTLRSIDQFRPRGPLSLTSAQWATEYNEVKTLGCRTCAARTPEMTEVGLFWSENTMATWSRAIQRLAVERNLDVIDTARYFALSFMAIADANTACWDTKFTFNFWRPEMAIHLGDTDGNPLTEPDTAWVPLLATPAHPDYTSGHACQTGAATQVIRLLFGAHVDYSVDSLVTHTTHSFTRWDGALREVNDARVWSGIHTRTADEHGGIIGVSVARQAVAHFLRPACARAAAEHDLAGLDGDLPPLP